MDKIDVEYKGGVSAHGTHAVDYMLAQVDGVELYTEVPPIDDDETGTYDELKAKIIEQALKEDINPEVLKFWYD